MPKPIAKKKSPRYFAIRVDGNTRIEKADTPWLACEAAFGVVYDRPEQKAEYKDCGSLKGSVHAVLWKEGGWHSLTRNKFKPAPAPEEVAPEIVKDQMAPPCTCWNKPGDNPECQLHRKAPARIDAQPSRTLVDVLHNAPMQELVKQAHAAEEPGRFVVQLVNGQYEWEKGSGPLDAAQILIFHTRGAAEKHANRNTTLGQVLTLSEALAIHQQSNPQPTTPCRFIVGDRVRYCPGNSYDVGTVTEVRYDERMGSYIVTADLPRGSFTAPVSRWDFALPSETNEDFARGMQPSRQPPTHLTLPAVQADPRDGSMPTSVASPQKTGPQRLLSWSKAKKAGTVTIKDSNGTGCYILRYTNGERIIAFSKITATEDGINVQQVPWYVRIVRSVRNPGDVTTSCTCPGFVGTGYCRHANAVYHFVIEGRV